MAAKVALSFFTYNRAGHIEEDLEAVAAETAKKGIDIYLFDGSTDDATGTVARKYIGQGYGHIHYHHYGDGEMDRFQRARDALFLPDAEYLWFCGDNFVVLPKYYDEILEYAGLSYDIITIYDKSLKETKCFDDPVSYAECAMIPFTHYGATIIKKELLYEEDFIDMSGISPAFWKVLLYMKAIDKQDFKGATIQIPLGELRLKSKYVTKSESQDYIWDIWIRDWYYAMMNIPKRYGAIKEDVMNKIDRELHFFSLKALIRQRAEGQFDREKCKEYREYISEVVLIPYWIVYLIAAIPQERCRQALGLKSRIFRR